MKNESKYLYDGFEFSDKYKEEVVEIIRHNTNVEIGGYRLWDGQRTHLMQSPWELTDFIFALKRYEIDTGHKLKRFLEVGFSSGFNNTVLSKFFQFDHIVGVDTFSSSINGDSLVGNIRFKNLTLVCGDSTSQRTLEVVSKLGLYDLIFIDADHTYKGVKKDFENYSVLFAGGGVMGFHDIECPGVNRFWLELKASKKYEMREFIYKGYTQQYGIGMLIINK